MRLKGYQVTTGDTASNVIDKFYEITTDAAFDKWSAAVFKPIYIPEQEPANRFLSAFAKLRNAIINFVASVHPNGTTRLPLDGFS